MVRKFQRNVFIYLQYSLILIFLIWLCFWFQISLQDCAKACVRYFLPNFCFSPHDKPFKNYEKMFLFHLKSSFRFRDIKIFVSLSSPLFLPVSNCFRGWSKENLKVYDVINCLNKNLITYFVWYLEKEIKFHI